MAAGVPQARLSKFIRLADSDDSGEISLSEWLRVITESRFDEIGSAIDLMCYVAGNHSIWLELIGSQMHKLHCRHVTVSLWGVKLQPETTQWEYIQHSNHKDLNKCWHSRQHENQGVGHACLFQRICCTLIMCCCFLQSAYNMLFCNYFAQQSCTVMNEQQWIFVSGNISRLGQKQQNNIEAHTNVW